MSSTTAPTAAITETPCVRCQEPGCGFFTERMNGTCYCGHSQADHQHRVTVFPPRGGCLQTRCTRFAVVGVERQITSFHERCNCSAAYSQHYPLQASTSRNSVNQMAAPPATQPVLVSLPTPVLTQPAPTMPTITPYQPRTATPSQSTPFGVPMSQPQGQAGSSRQPRARTRTNQEPAAMRNRRLALKIMIVLFPRDLNGSNQDDHGLPNISRLKTGEQHNLDLQFLVEQGLATTVELTAQRADHTLLPQIQQHFDSMIARADYQYPTIHLADMDLAPTAECRESRLAFSKMIFRLLKVGNLCGTGPALTVDKTVTHSSFTYEALKTRFHRPVMKHPMDTSIQGILYVSPRRKLQLVGPVDENKDVMHHCYTDFILAHLEKSTYQVDLDDEIAALSPEEREQTWRSEYPHPCRTTCPRSVQSNVWREEDGVSDDDDRDIEGSFLMGLAQRPLRIPPSASSLTTLSPLFGNLDVGPAPMNQNPPSPTLPPTLLPTSVPFGPPLAPLPQSAGDAHPDKPVEYQPSDGPPEWMNFQFFEAAIHRTRMPIILDTDEAFCVSANSVTAAAVGLVNAIKGVRQDKNARLVTSIVDIADRTPDFTAIEPVEVELSNMFSWCHWIFRAGDPNDDDNIGSAVMREVLAEALVFCQSAENDIVEHLGNSDDYVGLKISADGIVQQDTLDLYYAFGALCAIFMIKTHAAPEPFSPAFILAALRGIDSILEPAWIASISPAVSKILSLLPANPEEPIPNDRALRGFVEANLVNSRFESIQRSPPEQRAQIIRMLTINALLGSSERVVTSSPEFAAFSAGLDLYLTPSFPSFKEAISSSSKYLLSQCYNRRITSGEQVIPHLHFSYHRSATPDIIQSAQHLIPQITAAVKRYLLGKGHPFPDRVHGLANPDTIGQEMTDSGFRARRFVKVLSGLDMMPVADKRFQVSLYEDIREKALFNGEYNATTDFVPPLPHACLYDIDVWVNQPLIDALATADAPLGVDTEFDWALHLGIMKMGNDGFNA
ncbi:hypothetical protein BDZ97DRAFT_1913826 [Flammula alnicola]|nr:hypothetical protein BDZ97DRAFT_1913826 [Flammula alnicola]